MNHHPELELLEQYATGTLPLPVALCVATHMEFCAQCRAEVKALQALGGMLLEELPTAAVSAAALEQVLARIDRADTALPETAETAMPAPDLPRALRKLVPRGYAQLRWARVLPGLRVAKLDVGCNDYQVALHRVQAGHSVATHDHRGQEFTLVLNGSFSDVYGVYTDGDFILREASQPHRPLAAANEDCLCLAVQQAPVRFTGLFWRLLNPFLR